MLDAGIDVISTVNVQHLESLNDLVFELTGVRVRETFPDRILEEADEVVLVDLAPEELRERLRAGKVYDPSRIDAALENFFRLGEPGGAASARAARAVRGRRGAARGGHGQRDGAAGDPRADPRSGRARAELAAAASAGVAVVAAAGRRDRRAVGAAAGRAADRRAFRRAGGAAATGRAARCALPRGGELGRDRRRPRDGGRARRRPTCTWAPRPAGGPTRCCTGRC